MTLQSSVRFLDPNAVTGFETYRLLLISRIVTLSILTDLKHAASSLLLSEYLACPKRVTEDFLASCPCTFLFCFFNLQFLIIQQMLKHKRMHTHTILIKYNKIYNPRFHITAICNMTNCEVIQGFFHSVCSFQIFQVDCFTLTIKN